MSNLPSILNEQTKEWKNPFSENIGVQPNDNWECVFNRVKGETSISGVENKMIVIIEGRNLRTDDDGIKIELVKSS